MTEAERAVIEAAVDLEDLRTAAQCGPVSPDDVLTRLNALYDAVVELHNEHDGRWNPVRIASGAAPSDAEIDACRTPAGGWTKAQLAAWGVPWPPPKGWRNELRKRHASASSAASAPSPSGS